jgi:TRAP-type mannitol/chloroaromatic compound transport system permease small subunit
MLNLQPATLSLIVFAVAFAGCAAGIGPIRLADAIKTTLEKVAFASGWLLIVLMCVTCLDIVFRKLQLPIALTQFQEMEWHLHTAVFSAWMGYNYVINAHPRVDSYTETLTFRSKAWIELIGLTVLAVPFIWVLIAHGWTFLATSYLQNEGSENVTGLPYRWFIKGVFYFGLWLVFLACLSVALRLVAFLFLGKPQAEAGIDIGHSELEV